SLFLDDSCPERSHHSAWADNYRSYTDGSIRHTGGFAWNAALARESSFGFCHWRGDTGRWRLLILQWRLEEEETHHGSRKRFNYDLLLICGPVFPHEVAGFSGGAK